MFNSDKKIKSKIVIYFLLIMIGVFTLYPLIWMVYTSFKPQWAIFQNPLSLPKSLHLKNYVTAWITGNFYKYFINSIIITGASIIILLFLSSLAGFGFTRSNFKGREALFIFCIMGMMIGHQIYMINMYLIISKLSLLNTYTGIILAYSGWTPFGIFILRSFFKEVPKDIQDAARIDGCSEFGIYYRIMLPLAKPAISTVGIFYFVWIWRDFIYPLLLLQDPQMNTISVGLLNFQGKYSMDWGAQNAALTIGTIGPIIIYYIFQKQFVKGLIKGSIKG